MPKHTIRKVNALLQIHDRYKEVEEQYRKERLELEKKFHNLKEELFTERQNIISGEVEVPALEGESNYGDEDVQQGVPQFWLNALCAHPSINEIITEEDVPALMSLSNVTVVYDDDFSGFVLSFYFDENDYFKNSVLTKKYIPNPMDGELPIVESTLIEWKEGKDLRVKEIKKKVKAKSGENKGRITIVSKTVKKPSFFHYFNEHKDDDGYSSDSSQEGRSNVSSTGRTRFTVAADNEIATIIRTLIIPEAVLWFTGEALKRDDAENDEDADDENLNV